MDKLAGEIASQKFLECTFTPKINSYGEKRPMKEFLDLQKQFITYVDEKN